MNTKIEQPKWIDVYESPNNGGRILPTVVLTCGLPGSGKTTWAEDFVKRKPMVEIVCRDDFRRLQRDFQKGKKNKRIEKSAKVWRDNAVRKHIGYGQHVIVADTNLNLEARITQTKQLLQGLDYRLKVADFRHVSVEECIKRDKLRANSVGADVIIQMFYTHLVPKPIDINSVELGRKAVILDLDGTLARKHNGRDHYAKQGFLDDTLISANADVIFSSLTRMVETTRLAAHGVFVFTGRGANEIGREEIYTWLGCHMPYWWRPWVNSSVRFRVENDNRPDYIVKREMYDGLVKNGYTPVIAFDDRPQVCRMWDLLGLNTVKMGPYYEF